MIGGAPDPDLPAIPSGRLVDDLRGRTVRRALKRYADWIGDTFGWYGVFLYVLMFGSVLVSGVVEIEPRYHPADIALLSAPISIIAGGFFLFRALLPLRRVPLWIAPVDLYRLGLSPLPPGQVLAWPFLRGSLLIGGSLVALGVYWVVFVAREFAVSLQLGLPALAAFAVLDLRLRWLIYAGGAGRSWSSAGRGWSLLAAAAALIGLLAPGWGLAAPLYYAAPPGTLWLFLLALLTGWRTRVGLRDRYPSGFAHQAFLSAELRELTFSGFLTGQMFDLDRARQLTMQLRGRRTAIRPRVRLPRPRNTWGQAGLLGWRGAQMILRRTWQGLLMTVVLVPAGIAQGMRLPTSGLGLLFSALILGMLCGNLLGPPPEPANLPIRAGPRTLGRVLPGSLLIVAVGLLVFLPGVLWITWLRGSGFFSSALFSGLPGGAPGPLPLGLPLPTLGDLLQGVTVPLLGLTLLEKISVQSGQSHRRYQISVPSAFVALLPAITIGVRFSPAVAGIVNFALVILILRTFR